MGTYTIQTADGRERTFDKADEKMSEWYHNQRFARLDGSKVKKRKKKKEDKQENSK